MVQEQVLYQIVKLSSTFICQNNLNIHGFGLQKAAPTNSIVSCGDNIAFAQARLIRGDTRSPKTIFAWVMKIRQHLRQAKRDGNTEDAKIYASFLTKTLYVKDFAIVEVFKKSDYRKLAKDGFYLNGIKYVRFSASAGNIRRNCVVFCNAEIYPELKHRLMCGLTDRVKEINIAKLSAYFALSTSSVMWVDTPRVCVIPDAFTTLKDQKIDWVVNKDIILADGSVKTKKLVEERSVDIKMNSFDGQGLISPDMAKRWSENMSLKYVPSSFVVRTIWTKGNLVPFDFRAYAHENGISVIYDRWGNPHKIDEVDVLLSESQFKQYKYYSSYEDYLRYTSKYNIGWGVSRYNRAEDDEYVLANYQIIQVLNINNEDIKQLIDPTIDWIQKICTGDDLYALLYSLGGFSEDRIVTYNDLVVRAQNTAMKAVVKNPSFLKDTYVQKKIERSIKETINRAKIGKIWVRGNYSFMISDPIAQCRHALGLPMVGEIPGENIYSEFWEKKKSPGDQIVLCRSPLLDKHEVNHCALYVSDEAQKWYQHIHSGIIYSIYDLSTMRHSDSDFDGDLVMSSDNDVLLRGSMKDMTNPISYDKDAVPSQKICHKNFVETDIRGFGTKVGTYSNYSTIIEAMRPQFAIGSPQDDELLLRKKLLREINGQEIDRIKGVDAKGPPKDEWLKIQKIDPEDTDAEKQAKYYHNSLVLAKKPYFFRYLYPELNAKYKRYEKKYNETCKCMFRMPLKQLLAKKPKTELERTFVRRYYRYLPVITSNCTMNTLCREFESMSFDIQYNKKRVSMLPHKDLNEFKVDPEILRSIRSIYITFSSNKNLATVSKVFDGADPEEYKDFRFAAIDSTTEKIREEYAKLQLTPIDGLTYIYALSQSYTNFNWDFAWVLLDEDILSCIQQAPPVAPVETHEGAPGAVEYLGRYFALSPVSTDPIVRQPGEKPSYEEPKMEIISDEEFKLMVDKMREEMLRNKRPRA